MRTLHRSVAPEPMPSGRPPLVMRLMALAVTLIFIVAVAAVLIAGL